MTVYEVGSKFLIIAISTMPLKELRCIVRSPVLKSPFSIIFPLTFIPDNSIIHRNIIFAGIKDCGLFTILILMPGMGDPDFAIEQVHFIILLHGSGS